MPPISNLYCTLIRYRLQLLIHNICYVSCSFGTILITGGIFMAHEVYKFDDFQYSSTPFKLLYVTRAVYDKGWHSTPHTHHFTELFYIIDGKGSFVFMNEEIPVEKNDLVIINST